MVLTEECRPRPSALTFDLCPRPLISVSSVVCSVLSDRAAGWLRQPALGVAVSWLVAGLGNTALLVVTGLTLRRGHLSDTLLVLCVIEIVLVAALSLSAALVVCIDYRALREHAV